MTQYRVSADVLIKQTVLSSYYNNNNNSRDIDEITTLIDQLPSFVKAFFDVDLFDKYMPSVIDIEDNDDNNNNNNNNQQNDTILLNNNESNSYNQQQQKEDENLSENYCFWKDESKKKNTNSIPSTQSNTKTNNNKHNPSSTDKNTDISQQQEYKSNITCHIIQSRKVNVNQNHNDNEDIVVPDDENTVLLSSLHYSVLTDTLFKGVYYAFLMSHTLTGKKKDTNIGVSKNPIFSVMAHNNQALVNNNNQQPKSNIKKREDFPVIYDKDTASAAPSWKLDTVIGPFLRRKEAISCCHQWVKKTRGTTSKREKAPILAKHYGSDLYSSQVNITKPLDRYLHDINAPINYLKTCQQIKLQCKNLVHNDVSITKTLQSPTNR